MPKTVRNQFDKYLTYDNLMKAHLKCEKSKRNRENVIKFNLKQEEYINWLYKELKTRHYEHSNYTMFYVYEPKKRKIEAAKYIDRIVHRWLYDSFLEPNFLPELIDTTYACLPHKGMHKCVVDVQNAMKKCQKEYGEYYILKMDIKKYFQSIDKDILMNIIKRKIKDQDIIWLIKQTLFNKRSEPGIPIGNLSSQLFANLYYNETDQFIKHILKVRYYFRYMDDSIILMKDKESLKKVRLEIEDFIHNNLNLEFNSKTNVFKNKQGINFCGYKINEYRLKIRDKGKRKVKNKVKKLKWKIKNGEISSLEAKKYLCGHFGYMKIANTYNFVNKIFYNEEL